jgi:hypothetical protein
MSRYTFGLNSRKLSVFRAPIDNGQISGFPHLKFAWQTTISFLITDYSLYDFYYGK